MQIQGQALRTIGELMKILQENITGSVDPESRKKIGTVSSINGVPKVDSYLVNIPLLLENQCTSIISRHSKNETVERMLQEISNTIGEADGTTNIKSKLNSLLNAFSNADTFQSESKQKAALNQIKDAVRGFCGGMNSLDRELVTQMKEADKAIVRNVDLLNSAIKKAYKAKQYMNSVTDKNDSNALGAFRTTVQEIAKFVSVTENSNGDITTDGVLLVSHESYAVINYDGAISKEELLKNGTKPITVKYCNSDDNIDRNSTDITLSGGVIGGAAEIRDEILPKHRSEIRETGEKIVEQINAAAGGVCANKIDSAPLKGNEEFARKVTFAVVDKNGHKITRDGREVTSLTVDLDKLISSTGLASGTVQTIADEFNHHFQHAFRAPRTVIGEVLDSQGDPFAVPKYMVNNIRLQINHLTNTSLGYGFNIENTSGSNVEFEVVSYKMHEIDGNWYEYYMKGSLKSSILSNGQTMLSNGNHPIQIYNTSVVNNEIKIQFLLRVKDESGNLDTKTVQFNIPTDRGDITNNHYSPVTAGVPVVPVVGGAYAEQIAAVGGGFSTARAEIETIDGEDYLHFEGEGDYQIVIDGSNFAQKLGINNIITYDKDSDELNFQIDAKLTADSFPYHSIGLGAPETRTVNVGTQAATLTAAFAINVINPVNLVFAVGGYFEVKVDHGTGMQTYNFTFHNSPGIGAGPLNNDQIEIKNTWPEQLEEIVKKVNDLNSYTVGYHSMVKASVNGSRILFESPKGQQFNDKINIDFNGLGLVPTLTDGTGVVVAAANMNLAGGNSEERTITYAAPGDSHYNFSGLANLTHTSINADMTKTISKFLSDVTHAKAETKAAENIAEALSKERKEIVGVNVNEAMMSMVQLQHLSQAIMMAWSFQKQLTDYFFQMTAR